MSFSFCSVQLRSLQGLRTEIHDLREENLRLQELANRYLKLKADYDALLAEIAELKRENARLRDELARLKEGGDRYLRLKAEHDRLLADFEAQKRHLLRLEEVYVQIKLQPLFVSVFCRWCTWL